MQDFENKLKQVEDILSYVSYRVAFLCGAITALLVALNVDTTIIEALTAFFGTLAGGLGVKRHGFEAEYKGDVEISENFEENDNG